MKDFRVVIARRRWILTGLNFVAAFAIVGLFLLRRNFIVGDDSNMNDMIDGVRVGLLLGMEVIFLMKIQKTIKALGNEEQLRKLYIQETDERNTYIIQKTGSIGFNIALFGLAFAMFAASFFNMDVCLTLLGATLFLSLIKGGLKLYCRRVY